MSKIHERNLTLTSLKRKPEKIQWTLSFRKETEYSIKEIIKNLHTTALLPAEETIFISIREVVPTDPPPSTVFS